MFGKKKKLKEPKIIVDTNYVDWDKDLGFLNLLMIRKKNITKNYLINIYSGQLKDTDFIRDEDLAPIIEKSITEVLAQISGKYKEYIIEKYFGSKEELIKFITEDFFVDLTSSAINENYQKIKKNVTKQRVENMTSSTTTESKIKKKERNEE